MQFVFFLRKSQSLFEREWMGGYDWGHVGGATAVPRALWKVCFPSEHRYVFIEIPILQEQLLLQLYAK